jgi:hypothetical protein
MSELCYVRGWKRTKMYACIFIIFTLVALLTKHNEEAFLYLEYPSSKSYEFCDDNKSNNIELFFLNNNNINKNKLLFLKTSLA